ncbi:MAG TPA: DUF2339 domain-containing protein [Thermoleophilaceae bacterium]|jgi:uncharacterized membrane protein
MADVLEILRGNSQRLRAVEHEVAAMRKRIARLEGQAGAERRAAGQAPTEAGAERRAAGQAPGAERRSMLDWTPPAPDQRQAPRPEAPRPQASRPEAPAPAPSPAPPVAEPPARIDLEQLLGGRVLGLAGALAVLLGVAFLVAMAVERGWVDEPTRIAIGFGGCSALLLGAVYLYERRGQTQAALAAAGAAIAGLFATLTAGAQLYELFPVAVSLGIAAAVGAAATALALRWNARTFAGLGLLGAMAAPWLVGAAQSNLTISFVLLVLAIALAVADSRRWTWLTFGASVAAGAQVLQWLETAPDAVSTVLALTYFGAVHLAAAAGLERGREGEATDPAAAMLLGGAALFVAPSGYFGLDQLGHDAAAIAWLGAVAGVLAAAGLAGLATPRISRDLAHLSIAIGAVFGDIAFALAVDGVELALGWAASAALLVLLGRSREGHSDDADRLGVAAGAQLALALCHVLSVDAVPARLYEDPHDLLEGVLGLGAVGAAALLAAQLLPRTALVRPAGHAVALFALAYSTAFVLEGSALAAAWGVEAVAVVVLARRAGGDRVDPVGLTGSAALLGLALTHALTIDADPTQLVGSPEHMLDGVVALGAAGIGSLVAAQLLPRGVHRAIGHAAALLVLAYASAFVLDGPSLVAVWALEAAAILALAQRGGGGADAVGWVGSLSLLGLAAAHGLACEATPDALVYGVDDLAEAAIALASVAAAALAMWRLLPAERRNERLAFASVGAGALVYLGSVAIVTAFQPDGTGFETATGLLDERQRGQLLLSAFWAITGVGALLAGLARHARAVRLGGFLLLGIATAKVFLFDLSALEAMYRVGSFVALGLLLLGAAFAWQRAPRNGGAEA